MNPQNTIISFCLLAVCNLAYAQIEQRFYETQRVIENPPRIDGLGDDPSWDLVNWSGDFTQRDPVPDTLPSYPTQFKILYDAKNLYVLIRAFDDEPDKIVRRMSRRDGFDGDWVEINIDSYGDKRTAFSFTASVSGVKGDEYVSNDGDNWDYTWDPIWYLKTSIDDKGWIAEFRIPLSQLRFANKDEHVWGIQLTRRFFRNEERSIWQYFPKDDSGWVRHFGELRGLKGIKPQKQVEIMPYVVGKRETYKKEKDNPFLADGGEYGFDAGVDGKIGITSDITLDFTVNPDFGQVEADPSQINLSAYRLFFEERRPFFIEGKELFNYKLTESIAGGDFNLNRLFYSRNIGRRPHYSPDLNDDEYADEPKNTDILAATKITGKNRNGFSWGVLESVTAKEKAEIDENGDRRKITTEPLTNYTIARVQQDINKGNTVIGAMVTSTNRKIDAENLNFLHKNAYSGGIDLLHHIKERAYYVSFNSFFSHVRGSNEALLETQTASERFFQRPDNNHVTLDSTRTSLSGWGSTLKFGKSKGNIIGQTGITVRSPGLDLNDVGFLVNTDEINQWTWIQYRILKPFGILRDYSLNGNQYLHWDFGGVSLLKAFNFNTHLYFTNFWRFSAGTTRYGPNISNADLRGGPALKYPGMTEVWYYLSSDNRKKLWAGLNQWYDSGDKNYQSSFGTSFELAYRPFNALKISLDPSFVKNKFDLQYVETIDYNDGERYIVASLDQNTYRLSARINFIFTPDLSLQYWAQPFISSGKYDTFKRITNASNDSYEQRYQIFADERINYNADEEIYEIDEMGNGEVDYTFDNPDFNFVQFRSNLVLRWEYIPGSELFLVWTQERTDNLATNIERKFDRLSNGLFDAYPSNVFLIKATYRFMK